MSFATASLSCNHNIISMEYRRQRHGLKWNETCVSSYQKLKFMISTHSQHNTSYVYQAINYEIDSNLCKIWTNWVITWTREGRLRPILERAWESLSTTPRELQETVSSAKKVSLSFSLTDTAVTKVLIRPRGRWWNRDVCGEQEVDDDKLKGKNRNLGDDNEVNLQKLKIGIERWRIIRFTSRFVDFDSINQVCVSSWQKFWDYVLGVLLGFYVTYWSNMQIGPSLQV